MSEIDAAIEQLATGRVIAIPTDTVYGLAVDPFQPGASDRLFAVKRRPRDVELPVLVANVEQAMELSTAVLPVATTLMKHFWPGALTIIVPRNPDIDADLGSDDLTIGLRCPDHPIPRELCVQKGPLATTSANLHGEPPLTTAQEVRDKFGNNVALVLDGGSCQGSPSTVVDCTGEIPKVLREGRIPWIDIEAAL